MMTKQLTEKPFPPQQHMLKLMDKLTKTYVFLWNTKDASNQINATWDDVTKTHNKNSFRSCIRKLHNEGLLSYSEDESGICIKMISKPET